MVKVSSSRTYRPHDDVDVEDVPAHHTVDEVDIPHLAR